MPYDKWDLIRLNPFLRVASVVASSSGGGGEGIPIYGLDRYVPPDRVWFLRVSILQYGIIFAHFGIVFPVCSLDRVSKF